MILNNGIHIYVFNLHAADPFLGVEKMFQERSLGCKVLGYTKIVLQNQSNRSILVDPSQNKLGLIPFCAVLRKNIKIGL